MLDAFTAILCTMMIAAGWFYLVRSQGVERLQGLESPRRNAARRKTRRMGAWSMILLGVGWFWLMWELQRKASAIRTLFAFVIVVLSLMTMVLCALVDMYLTNRMRRTNGPHK